MDVKEVVWKLSEAGCVVGNGETSFETLSIKELEEKSKSDEYAAIIRKTLIINSDCLNDLYLYQYEALHALARGSDVLLIYPCGAGKTRVLDNAPCVVKLGYELRSGEKIDKNPLGIICCPLTSIIEDKITDKEDSGMLSMYGSCKSTSVDSDKVSLSTSENEFYSDKLSFIYGHPESYATEMGKRVLENNEDRIFVFITDEVGYNVWGPQFRALMSTIPGSIRVFSSVNAPMLCMSATVGRSEQQTVLQDMGMNNRNHLVLDKNPLPSHVFISKLVRPSNQTNFSNSDGLKDILCELYLDEFIADPMKSRKAIIFCKHEEDLIKVYEFLEQAVGEKYKNMKTRPWIQYHGSTGENTLRWIHHRIKSSDKDLEIKLYISTYKLVMGVDIKNIDLAIFIRPPNTVPCLVQGIGRVGRSSSYGSKKAGIVILFNDEDLKANVPGMTDDVRCLLRSSECLKEQLAIHFGYTFAHSSDWCCSAKVSSNSFVSANQEDIAEETEENVFALPAVQSNVQEGNCAQSQ